MRTDDIHALPADLPIPVDDGACDHLRGLALPDVELGSTAGDIVEVGALAGAVVVYCYPRTGRLGQELPKSWNEIPGARGCTRNRAGSAITTASCKPLEPRSTG